MTCPEAFSASCWSGGATSRNPCPCANHPFAHQHFWPPIAPTPKTQGASQSPRQGSLGLERPPAGAVRCLFAGKSRAGGRGGRRERRGALEQSRNVPWNQSLRRCGTPPYCGFELTTAGRRIGLVFWVQRHRYWTLDRAELLRYVRNRLRRGWVGPAFSPQAATLGSWLEERWPRWDRGWRAVARQEATPNDGGAHESRRLL